MSTNRQIILKQNNRWKINTNSEKKIKPKFGVTNNSKTPWSKKNNRKYHSARAVNNRFSSLANNEKKKKVNITEMHFPPLSSNNCIQKNTVWCDPSKQKIIKKSAAFINRGSRYCCYTKKKIKKDIEIIGMKNIYDTKLYFDGLNNLKRYNHLHNCKLKRLEVDSDGNHKLFEVSSIVDNDYQEPVYSEEEYYSEEGNYSEDDYY
jgi:hypothetical protein